MEDLDMHVKHESPTQIKLWRDHVLTLIDLKKAKRK